MSEDIIWSYNPCKLKTKVDTPSSFWKWAVRLLNSYIVLIIPSIQVKQIHICYYIKLHWYMYKKSANSEALNLKYL
jgi:hypothetical protein